MSSFFFTVLLPASAVGAVAVLMLYGTNALLDRFGKTRWNLRVLLVALCLFLLPLGLLRLPVPAPVAVHSVSRGEAVRQDPAVSAPAPSAVPTVPVPDGVFKSALPAENTPVRAEILRPVLENAARCLPALWVAGMLAVLLGTAVSYLRFSRRLLRKSRCIETDRLTQSAEENGLRRRVLLRETDALTSPMVVGLLRPCIYLPAGMAQSETLSFVLRHEAAHLRRGHLFCKLLAQLVCAAHWFDPAAWLLRRMVNEACEFDCDRAVTRGFCEEEKLRYCTALLNAVEEGKTRQLVSAFSRPARLLQKRMEAVLMHKDITGRRIGLLLLCAALVCGMVWLTACAAQTAYDGADALLTSSAVQTDAQNVPDARSSTPDAPAAQRESDPVSAPKEEAPTREPSDADAPEADVWPVPGYTMITTKFAAGGHRGIDICAPMGSEILAMRGGLVLNAEFHWSMGNYVWIDHEDGTTARYAHCSSLTVQPGDRVQAGQQIACVGSTGYSTGNHCHVEFTRDDELVDPLEFAIFEEGPEPQPAVAEGTSFIAGMGCCDTTCTNASHHHDCLPDCEEHDHHHTCPIDCTGWVHHHGRLPASVAQAAPTAFVAGMGCSDPTCTDASHHHDCPADCTDYDHHHTCPLDCRDPLHLHGGASSSGMHHSGTHHSGRHHG